MKKILLTGGGTAGHIMPILAIAESLKTNQRLKIIYVGSSSGMEKELVSKSGIRFKGILVGKWRNYFSLLNYFDLFKTAVGVIQTFFLELFFRPDVIFAKGGFVTFPVVFWAKFFKIPVVIHESDSVMGKANAWAAKYAQTICVGFPIENYPKIDRDKLRYTGIPLQKEFFKNLSIESEKPTILVTGGSLGSAKINELIWKILPDLLKKYEIFHIVGQSNFSQIPTEFQNDPNYHAFGFTADIPKIMRGANLIISRASATTLAEISALAKPSILIPLPLAAQNHQAINAKIYEEKSAAIVLGESSLTANSFLSIINNLMEDEKLRNLLGHHAKQFAQKEAAEEIIEVLFKVMKNG